MARKMGALLTLAATDPTADNHATRKIFVDTALALKADLVSPTFTGTPTLPSGTIATTQASGTNGTSLATTAFVQAATAAVISGLDWHEKVVVATAAALPACTYANGTAGVGATLTADGVGALTVDGVAMDTVGYRIVVKD